MRLGPVLGAMFATAAAGCLANACRGPTEITIDIRTAADLRCPDIQALGIVVAPSPEEAEAREQSDFLSARSEQRCEDDHHVGTLVVTPGGGAGAVVVTAALTSKACRPPAYEGCIVARRTFGFVEHASARLPITLEASCRDQPCGVLTSCRTGACVSSHADCSADADCTSDAEPVTGPDGRPIPPDAASDATADARGEAASDAAVDAPLDARADVDQSSFGNTCPADPPADCAANGSTCCYMGTFFCEQPCTQGYYAFNCLGRKHCNGAYCCGTPPGGGPVSTSCDTTGGQMCAQNGSHYICTTDADCPPAKPRCAGTYLTGTSGTAKECAP